MSDYMASVEVDNGTDFNVGNDGLGTFNNEKYDIQLQMDDFIVYNGALTEEDIANLRDYYGLN